MAEAAEWVAAWASAYSSVSPSGSVTEEAESLSAWPLLLPWRLPSLLP